MQELGRLPGSRASKVSFQRSDPISKTALDCTLHLKVVVDDDEPINKLFREIANPYGDLKQNRFLQKTVTVDVKNLNSKNEAYQEVLAMLQERDELLFQAEVSKLNLFNAKKAAEDSRIKSLNAEMEVDLARNALLSRQIQLKYLLDDSQAGEVKAELQKVCDKLKDMVTAATTLATTTQIQFAELDDLRQIAVKASNRYSDFSAEFSAACYRAIEAGKAGHWQGELQRHEATLYRYAVPLTGFSGSSYFDAHKETLGADDRPKQLSGNDYQCSYGCGFAGLYHVVAKHELTCPSAPTAP